MDEVLDDLLACEQFLHFTQVLLNVVGVEFLFLRHGRGRLRFEPEFYGLGALHATLPHLLGARFRHLRAILAALHRDRSAVGRQGTCEAAMRRWIRSAWAARRGP